MVGLGLVVVCVWRVWLRHRWWVLHLLLWWGWAAWLGRLLVLQRQGRLHWSRGWGRCHGLWRRGWRQWFWRCCGRRYGLLRRCRLLLGQNLGELVDVGLEELELRLARLACCDNLHDGLELWIRSGACCQHVDHGIRGRCRRRRWRRRGGHGLWRRRSRCRLGVRGLAAVLRVLVGLAVLAVVRPRAVGRRGRRLLGHRPDHLARRKQPDRQRVRLDDQLRDRLVAADLREVLDELLLALHPGLVLVSPVRRLLGVHEVGVEGAEVGAGDPHGARPLERGLEHAALLDVVPLARREVERLWLGQRRQGRAVRQPERQRLRRRPGRAMGGCRGRRVLDGDAGPLALQRRFGTLGRLRGRRGRGRRGVFTGARPRGPPGLSHGAMGAACHRTVEAAVGHHHGSFPRAPR